MLLLINKLFQQILSAYSKSDWSKVEMLCEELLTIEPDHVDTLQLRGISAFNLGISDKAIDYFNQAVEFSEQRPAILCNLANVQQQLNLPEEAIKNYQTAIKKQPDLVDAHNNLGNLHLEMNQLDLAENCFKQALSLNPQYWEAEANQGRLHLIRKQWQQAISSFKKALNINPDALDCLNDCGYAFLKLNDFKSAQLYLDKALKLSPQHLPSMRNQVLVLTELNSHSRALMLLSKVNALDGEKNGEVEGETAHVLLKMGNFEGAINYFKKALIYSPENAQCFVPLSAIYKAQDKTIEARNLLLDGFKEKAWYFEECQNNPLANVLTFSGMQNCNFDLETGNLINLDGGHFNTQWLLDKNKFSRTRYFIFDKNIEKQQELPQHQLLMNTISDTDLEKESLVSLCHYLEKNPELKIINHPEKVLLTTRDNNYQRFKDVEGLIFPRTKRIKSLSGQNEQILNELEIEGFEFPYLFRLTGTQTGTTFEKIESRQQAGEYLNKIIDKELYVIQYIDTHFADNKFRRFRCYFVDGILYPDNCHMDYEWNVHSVNRSKIMAKQKELQELEQKFLNDPSVFLGMKNFNALSKLPDIVKLDFFGVDFSLNSDNELIIFEVNCSMNHTYNFLHLYPYLQTTLDNVTQAFVDMVVSRIPKT